ncbi:MAG: hypothetical protein Q8S84_03220 [bacterium]|nr:hypothetical protein [bacterium]MDP3380537.1 hypothetical protein [bacterium]
MISFPFRNFLCFKIFLKSEYIFLNCSIFHSFTGILHLLSASHTINSFSNKECIINFLAFSFFISGIINNFI